MPAARTPPCDSDGGMAGGGNGAQIVRVSSTCPAGKTEACVATMSSPSGRTLLQGGTEARISYRSRSARAGGYLAGFVQRFDVFDGDDGVGPIGPAGRRYPRRRPARQGAASAGRRAWPRRWLLARTAKPSIALACGSAAKSVRAQTGSASTRPSASFFIQRDASFRAQHAPQPGCAQGRFSSLLSGFGEWGCRGGRGHAERLYLTPR